MVKFAKYFVILIGALLIFEAFGKRPNTTMNISITNADIPNDIDSWLAEKEANIKNLRPNTSKEIIWNDPRKKNKTKISLVYIHGFPASKTELAPTPQLIAKELGANLYLARLSGHGRDREAMEEITLSKWADDIAEALHIGERLGEKTVVFSGSTGGTLATWAANMPQFSDSILTLITMSPNFSLNGASNGQLNMPWAETILPLIYGKTLHIEPQNDMHAAGWTIEYPTSSVIKLGALLRVVSDIDFSKIDIPHLFFYSKKDALVSYIETEAAIKSWGGPSKAIQIENSMDKMNHILSGDALSPNTTTEVVDATVDWIRQFE